MTEELRVFTFAPGWGLPSVGPFALKVLAWLAHTRTPYTQVIENRASKGPRGKSPWMEQGGLRLGDSDAIVRHLAAQRGLADPTATNTPAQARARAMQIAFEERFHQILEWDMFMHPDAAEPMRSLIGAGLPPGFGWIVFAGLRRHFRKQLHARGIGRLAADEIADAGKRMLDGLALCLEDGHGHLASNEPELPDFAVWGQIAPMLCWPMRTPVAQHARSLEPLRRLHADMLALCNHSS